jgi:hypothetical protein
MTSKQKPYRIRGKGNGRFTAMKETPKNENTVPRKLSFKTENKISSPKSCSIGNAPIRGNEELVSVRTHENT